jgi:hypothetical protein
VAWDPTSPLPTVPAAPAAPTTEFDPAGGRRLVEVRVDADRAAPVLLVAVVALGLAAFSGALVRTGVLALDLPGLSAWVSATDPDRAGTVPSWFQSALMVLAALLLWTTADDARARGDHRAGAWRWAALGAVALSVDELVDVHERVVGPVARLLGGGLLGDLAWGVVAVPVVAVAALAGLGPVRSLPRSTASGILLAGALYVGGAVVMDVVGTVLGSAVGPDSLLLASSSVVEEAMEMLALTVLVLVVSRYAATANRTAEPTPRTAADPTAWTAAVDLTPFAPQPAYPAAPAWAVPGGAARAETLSVGGSFGETEILPPPPPLGRRARRGEYGDG